MMELCICEHCGKSFKGRNGRPNRYCSKVCDNARKARKECTCRFCGVTYKPKHADRTSYCSRDCAHLAMADGSFEGKCSVCRKPVKTSGTYCVCDECRRTRDEAKLKQKPKEIGDCSVCGREFEKVNRRHGTCSAECRRRAQWKDPSVDRRCAVCGKQMHRTVRLGRITTVCSDECASARWKHYHRKWARISKRRRRAIADSTGKNERYNDRDIFIRDEYRCQLCGIECLKDGQYNTDNPQTEWPTIDHIVPLSRGGWDATDNVMCVCWACNILWGNRMEGKLEAVASVREKLAALNSTRQMDC